MKLKLKYIALGLAISMSTTVNSASWCCQSLCAKFSGNDYQECIRTCVDTGSFCYLM